MSSLRAVVVQRPRRSDAATGQGGRLPVLAAFGRLGAGKLRRLASSNQSTSGHARSIRAQVKLALAKRPGLYRAARRTNALAQFALRRPHEPDFAAFALFPHRTGLFLDVGANSGQSALSFRIYNRRSPILSVEPNPFHEPDLRVLRRLLRDFDYVILAAGEEEGESLLHVPVFHRLPLTGEASLSIRHDPPWWIRQQKASSDVDALQIESVPVKVTPLDVLGLRPDYVKVDVEGYEGAVLRGLYETLREHHPVLLVEHSGSHDEVDAVVGQLSYRPFTYRAGAKRLAPFEAESVSNLFYLPADEAARWL